MLSAFRKLGKSWLAPAIFGVLIVSMAVFAVPQDLLSGQSGDWVVSTRDRKVSGRDFRTRYDQAKTQAEQQAGQPITPDMAVQAGFDQQVLTSTADEAALATLMLKLGARPSEKLFNDQLQQYPAFFDQVTGKFDQNTYRTRLAEVGVTPAIFKRDTLDNLALNHVSAALGMGLRAPRAYVALAAALYLEKRDIAYFEFGSSAVDAPAAPTDAQLRELLTSSGIKTPELRDISVVRFSAAAAPPVTITQQALQQRYDFEKDSLNRPETRTFVAISGLRDAAQAREAAARLARNEDPAAVAKAYGKEPVTTSNRPKTAIPDRAMADAVFAINGGQVTPPIQTSLGFAVARVTGIVAGSSVTFEQARPQLEQTLRQEAAVQKAYDQTEAYTKSREAGATIDKAAADAGVRVTTYTEVAADLTDKNGQPIEGIPVPVVQAAFRLAQGEESDVTEVEKGEYFVVRVTKVQAERTPPLEEVRPSLTQAYIQQKTEQALIAKANTLRDRLQKGERIETVAAEVRGAVKRIAAIDRIGAQQRPGDQAILGPAFNATKPGEAFNARMTTGVAVGKVERIMPGDAAAMGTLINQQRENLSEQVWGDYVTELRKLAVAQSKVKTSLDRARLAIGVDSDTVKRLADAAKAAPAKAAPAKAP